MAYKVPNDMKDLKKKWRKDAYIEWTNQGKPLGNKAPQTPAKRKARLRPITPTKRGGRGRGK